MAGLRAHPGRLASPALRSAAAVRRRLMDGSGPDVSDQGVLALEGWEQPARRQPGPAAPVLAVVGFEGPLDWLFDLARTRRIDLARLSIVALIEAFEEALTAALAPPDLRPTLLGRWDDWLVMAADLTLLRSRSLVPAGATAAQDATMRRNGCGSTCWAGRKSTAPRTGWRAGASLVVMSSGAVKRTGQGSCERDERGTSPACCGRVWSRSAYPPKPVCSTKCPGRRSGAWPTRPRESGPCCLWWGKAAPCWRPSCPRCGRPIKARVAVPGGSGGTFLAGLELSETAASSSPSSRRLGRSSNSGSRRHRNRRQPYNARGVVLLIGQTAAWPRRSHACALGKYIRRAFKRGWCSQTKFVKLLFMVRSENR